MLFCLEKVRYKHIINIDHLEIPEGVVSCIYGESGGGKTTLLRLLNHLISADQGRVLFRGVDVTKLDPIALRRQAVMLAQTPIVFDGTVRDNLQIGLQFAEKPEALDDTLEKMLRVVSLNKNLTQSAHNLSGGERQRLALARVLLLAPEVLLLDEPSASLDEDTEQLVLDAVVAYAQEKGNTVIMITHSRKMVERYGDYRIALLQGRVTAAKEGVATWKTG